MDQPSRHAPRGLSTTNAGEHRARHKRDVWPRWLRRTSAADYLSVSPSQFDKWISLGMVPLPKKIVGVVLWDRFALDEAMEAIFYPVAETDLAAWDDVRA